MSKKLKEITLSPNQCRSILRGETVTDKKTGFIFDLIEDQEEDIVFIEDNINNNSYYQREGIGICIEKESKIVYKFNYSESGRDPEDMSCYCSGFLTEIKNYKYK